MNKILLIAASAVLMLTYTSCKKETITETKIVTVTNTDTVLLNTKTIVIGATHDATIKADINNGTVDSNYASGAGEILGVGVGGNEQEKFRTLIQFDLSNLPAGATVTDVKLNFTLNRAGPNIETIYVHKLTEDWQKGSVTDDAVVGDRNSANDICEEINVLGTAAVTWKYSRYSTFTEWNTPGGAMTADASDSSSSKFSNNLSFNSEGLLSDVQNWIASPTANFGWVLRYNDAAEANDDSERFMRYLSAEGGAANGGKPKLIITYTE